MRVLIADRHDQVRSALRFLLEQETNIEAIGEVPGAESLLAQVRHFRPDILLLDWRLVGTGIEELVTELRKITALEIVILSSRPEDRKAAVTAGLVNYVSKNAFSEELLSVLREIIAAH
jgi:DNA-binding NarL/FixJ family response regulator